MKQASKPASKQSSEHGNTRKHTLTQTWTNRYTHKHAQKKASKRASKQSKQQTNNRKENWSAPKLADLPCVCAPGVGASVVSHSGSPLRIITLVIRFSKQRTKATRNHNVDDPPFKAVTYNLQNLQHLFYLQALKGGLPTLRFRVAFILSIQGCTSQQNKSRNKKKLPSFPSANTWVRSHHSWDRQLFVLVGPEQITICSWQSGRGVPISTHFQHYDLHVSVSFRFLCVSGHKKSKS